MNEPSSECDEQREPVTTHDTTGVTVLLVDDERSIRNLCEKYVKGLGYKVLAAASAAEALALCDQYAGGIQILLTDLVMPGVSGRVLASQISLKSPNIKCLYMSGYPAEKMVQAGHLDKGCAFIEKPFSHVVLGQRIQELLDQK